MVLAGPTGATAGPVSYRVLAGMRQVMGDQGRHVRAGGPRAERAHLRPAAGAHDHMGRIVTEDREPLRFPQPPTMSRALRYSPLRDCAVAAFIVSRGASFINTCTDTIIGRVMACGSDGAIPSDTLLPLFASS